MGQHVKDDLYPLSGEDGVSVKGVQAGVDSAVRLRLKFFSCVCNYLEIHLDQATCLPKMDSGACIVMALLRVGVVLLISIELPLSSTATDNIHAK